MLAISELQHTMMTNDSAVDRAFGNLSILCRILQHLPLGDIDAVASVSPEWLDAIQTVEALQKQCWIPRAGVTGALCMRSYTCDLPCYASKIELNPCIFRIRSPVSIPISPGIFYNTEVHRLRSMAGTKTYIRFDISCYFTATVLAAYEARCLDTHPPSWVNMPLTNPPINTVALFGEWTRGLRSSDEKGFRIEKQVVTLGHVITALAELQSETGDLSEKSVNHGCAEWRASFMCAHPGVQSGTRRPKDRSVGNNPFSSSGRNPIIDDDDTEEEEPTKRGRNFPAGHELASSKRRLRSVGIWRTTIRPLIENPEH